MNFNSKILVVISFLGILASSCSSDDDNNLNIEAPKISNFEYGEGSAHSTDQVAYKGSDIHVEAEINAASTVSSIAISIHAHDLTPTENEVEWDFEKIYTDKKYLVINPIFHEHIDIPDNIPAGEYHIVLTVNDELGNSTEVEGHLQILDAIVLSNFSIDATAIRGSDIHAEFIINAINGVHNITINIHAHAITPGAGEAEWDYEGTFEEGYHELTKVEFHEHIDIPANAPAGEYHIVFKVEDEKGNIKEYSTHVDVTTE